MQKEENSLKNSQLKFEVKVENIFSGNLFQFPTNLKQKKKIFFYISIKKKT